MNGGLFCDVVIRQRPSVIKLFPAEDEALLIGRDTLFILQLGFDAFNRVGGFNLHGDSFACEGSDEDLHPTFQPEDQVDGRFFLDVVVGEGSAIFQRFAGKDQSLLVSGDALLVLDLSLHVLDGVLALDL